MSLRDPYRNYKFEVEIDGFDRAGFNKITGLAHNVEVIEYREGGENETPLKLPGQSSFDNIVLERGLSEDEDFIAWINEVFNLDNTSGAQGENEDFRRDVSIFLKDKKGDRVRKWRVSNAWPTKYDLGDLDASASEVLISRLELANEGWTEEAL